MLRRLYDRTMALAAGPKAEPTLAVVSFAESSFFPIPPDVLLIPMVLANRANAWRYAAVATIASVLGGLLGYFIGAVLFDTIGQWLIHLYGYGNRVAEFQAAYNEWGAWIILIKGATPIPYKIVTIASGFARYDLFWFVLLSVITRGIRFFLVAGLLYRFGEPVREFVERRLTLVTTLFVVALVGGFVVLRYVV